MYTTMELKKELARELELKSIGLKIKFTAVLKHFIYSNFDKNYLYRIMDILKDKYKNTDDFIFLENIRMNLQNHRSLEDKFLLIGGHVYNNQNDNVLKDIIECIDTRFNCDFNQSIRNIDTTQQQLAGQVSGVCASQQQLVEQVGEVGATLAIVEENTNILVDKK